MWDVSLKDEKKKIEDRHQRRSYGDEGSYSTEIVRSAARTVFKKWLFDN